MKYVDQERLERWLIRKTRKLKNKGSKKNVNSVEHENNKQSGKSLVQLAINVNLFMKSFFLKIAVINSSRKLLLIKKEKKKKRKEKRH